MPVYLIICYKCGYTFTSWIPTEYAIVICPRCGNKMDFTDPCD